MDRSPSGTNVPTSVILARLVRDAPAGHVTLAWLMDYLRTRSFGIVLLLLGVCGLLPVLSTLAGLLLFIAAFQMIRAQAAPVFPRRIAERPIATDKLSAMLLRIIPALHYLERFICPRWRTPFETTKRVIGVAVLLLGVRRDTQEHVPHVGSPGQTAGVQHRFLPHRLKHAAELGPHILLDIVEA